MIKKILKISTAIILLTVIFNTLNCFATANEKIFIKEDIEYIKKTYSISQEQEGEFLFNLEKEVKIGKKTYQLDNKVKTGGNTTETINISTTRTIETDSNKLEDILQQLPENIDYNKNNFVGKYKLDVNSLDIKTQYNGYKEKLIKETKIYTDLDTNDLNNIPKQIKKDGRTLDLITTNWEVTETRKIQKNSIPSKYKAICYYATKIKVNNPLTYVITAQYNGTADKTIENDYIYEITYKHIATDKNYMPAIILASGVTLIILIIIITKKNNVTIYNFYNNEWKEIGKQRISRPIVKLDRYNYKTKSNMYRIVIDEKFIDENNGKMLKLIRQDKVVEKLINKSNNIIPYIIDIVI